MRSHVHLSLVCVSLLTLAACSSAGNTTNPSPTATALPHATATSASGMTTYTSPDHKYHISYPSGWQVAQADGNPGKVDFSGPSQNFEVSDDASTPGGDPAQLITDWCNAIGQTTSQVVKGTPVVLAGQTWLKAECGDTAQPTEPLIVEVVTYKGAVYQIDYSSAAASFQTDETTYYAPMEQSFQFLT